jgi:RNA polymerase sigma-70 factor (ECF subfamily)
MDAESARWVRSLAAGSPARESATGELHGLLLRAAHAEAARRSGYNGVAGVELEDLAAQAASDAVLSILRRIDSFRGDSRFTTWAYKFVILEVSSKLARHAWRRERAHPDPEAWERLPDVLGIAPEESAEARDLLQAVQLGVERALTPHQRRVFVAVVVHAMPLDALVAELGTNRNAVYKVMFDARRKLRTYLDEQGFLERLEQPAVTPPP